MAARKILLVVLTLVCGYARSQEYVNGECYISGVPARCEPIRMSFSLGQEASASSTCGDPPTPFCDRTVSLGTVTSDCSGGDVCDANDPSNAHGVLYLTDFPLNDMSWWQSENSLSTSDRVVIDIPLLTLAEITFISFDFHSIKAAAFHLERSTDYGRTYRPYHYFAISCEDKFGILPEAELTSLNETSILCQRIPEPPSPGTISFFPAIDRPSANDSTPGYSEALYQFITATNIRVVLDQHYPLELAEDDPGYYYALDDINVIGSCQCYGHASQCIQNGQTGAYECVCSHNTAGTYCEQCQDFYNDVPWQRADGNGPFECKICNCNNHSNVCMFDMQVYEETGQTSGGVCINCDGNTDGRQCEICAPLYYPRPDRIQTDPDICEECQCFLAGVVNNGDCAKEGEGIREPGDCYCKINVMGKQCDMCRPGYYNLSEGNPDGCQECNCSINGSSTQTCNHITGECECKLNFIGSQCDTCRENHYQPDTSLGCLPCDCNLGASYSAQCDMTTGQCNCLPGVTGRQCSNSIPGKFFPFIDHLRLEGESASSIPSSTLTLSSGEGELFTGTGYYRVVEGGGISNFGTLVFPMSGTYEILFRYNLMGSLIWNTVTLTIRAGDEEGTGTVDCGSGVELPVGDTSVQYSTWNMGTGLAISRNFCFRAGRSYAFILSELVSGQSPSPTLDIDSLVAIPVDIPSLAIFGNSQLTSDYMSCVDVWRRVPTISSAEPICERITFTFSTAIYNGTQECDCDPDGSLAGTDCEMFGGQCVCLPGVRGRRCDKCSPGTFNFSPTGCTSCACNAVGSASDLCHPDLGTCECLPNVAGADCSMCEPNFWGLADGIGCVPCSCNDIGSINQQCHSVSGECTCRPGVIGTQCDMCRDAHYGFSSNGCSPCECDQAGSVGQDCDVLMGQCVCKENTRTRDCSKCASGTFNLQVNNPSGCQPCFCSGMDITCSAAPGYIAANISTEFSSEALDLQGWRVLTTNLSVHPFPDSVVTTMPFSNGVTITPNSAAYLQAPQQYLGNRLSSYLQFITISLESLSVTVIVETTTQFDIILAGNNLELGAQFPTGSITNVNLQIQLHESFEWYHIGSNQAASANDMQTVLSSLEQLYITASFNSSIILSSIQLDTVQITNVDDPATVTWVEQCNCPIGYSGLSCQQCSPGYTRSPSGSCELCQCNGFSETCNIDTGECIECGGSTTGDSCEQCLPGTYGDPIQGIPCLPCPCPMTSTPGQFTEECILQQPNTIICLNCPTGHIGDRCESCSEGYFGDPTGDTGIPTGCSDCLCNGNINSNLPGNCNVTTGVCLQCINNTAGNMCERCANGYFGDAIIAKNCSACECNPTGSVDSTCDHQTGECMCLPNVEGTRCEQCSPGYYNFKSGTGCMPCNCNQAGSVNTECHPDIGQCNCKPGVTGIFCDQCLTGYFGFSEDGCQVCNCSASNSLLSTCDDSGTCQCQAGSTGTNCEICIDNYFQDSQGCKECPQCYQDLEARVASISTALNTTESTLFNLFIETSPYKPRLDAIQGEVDSITSSSLMSSVLHRTLQMQVALLTSIINGTLRQELTKLEATIQILKTTSTPVFIQALASEELMNRTINDFLLVQQESQVDLLADYVSNITQSLSTLNVSHSLSTETLQSLTSQVQLLYTQAQQISELVSELQSIASVTLGSIEEIRSLSGDTIILTVSLQQNLTYIQQNVYSLRQQIKYFAMDIMQINIHIQIPTVPSSNELTMLLGNLSTSQHNIADLEDQLTEKQTDLQLLGDNLVESEIKTDYLLQDISNISYEIANLNNRAQEAKNITMTTRDDIEWKISEAGEVLVNLKNYNNDTFEVARRANAALQSVAEITTDAINVMNTTNSIQQNVSEVIDILHEAMDVANTAENVTVAAYMGVSGVNTDILVTNASATQSNIENSREQVQQLEMEAEDFSENLSTIDESISRAEKLVQNASAVVSESDKLLSRANSSVRDVEAALSTLNALESSQLQDALDDLQSLLSSLESGVSSADIQMWYAFLRQNLNEQKTIRLELEQSLVAMQEEVQHLQYLESMLPQACNSNL